MSGSSPPRATPHDARDRRPGPRWLATPDAALRLVRTVGVVTPLLFLGVLHAGRPVVERLLPSWGGHLVGGLTLAAALAFGLTIFLLADRLYGETQARALAAEHLQAMTAERDRIARELHDSLAQVLGATHLRLAALESDTSVPDGVRSELMAISEGCREAYTDVREAIGGLKDASGTRRPLGDSLGDYVRRFARQSGIEATAEIEAPLTLDPVCELHVARVVQEALTNVRKHAGASRAQVRVNGSGGHVTFEISDDGQGFDTTSVGGDGFGLRSMRERAALVQGQLHVASQPGRGTTIVLTVPCAATSATASRVPA